MRGIILLSLLGVLSAQWPLGSRVPLENKHGFGNQTENHPLVDTESNQMNYSQYIVAEEQKCLERMNTYPPYNESGLYCNRTWDGWRCWDDTPAGKLEWQNCPGYFVDFNEQEIVTRFCTESGQWFVHPETQKEWSNYTLCVNRRLNELPPPNSLLTSLRTISSTLTCQDSKRPLHGDCSPQDIEPQINP
ncbi:calcitonin receptor isoform X1 [Esox lucius]|uniref:calcitonin receptor isoform X1 n=1 Tax=Esox lucius TaxID=8010 RepID=UPI001477422E|nr:calcitonin receptor isoform X1 [Esox lucius]